MTSSRQAFLERVRSAVEAGNRAGHARALEPRGATGYLSASGLFAQVGGPPRSAPRLGAAGPDALRRHFEYGAIRLLRAASAVGFRE